MNDTDFSAFDASRVELLEALSHPLRVRILRVLGERSQRFSELKHTLGLESSGHLSFHLEKLGNLVKTTLEGDYELSDEGTEALRLARARASGSKDVDSQEWRPRRTAES